LLFKTFKTVAVIGIIDCNNFYASCERNFDPKLICKPIVILSNNDGAVIARSEEAKALGIGMATPMYEVDKLIKEHSIAKFSSNYTLYGDMSARIKRIIRQYAPNVEDYSIDESFVDLKGLEYFNLYDYCKMMRENISQGSGIPVSIGVGSTKTLAKIANRIVKKLFRQQGVYILDTPEKIESALKFTEIEDIWGVGRRLKAKLNAKGIFTAYDLSKVPNDVAKRNYSVVLQRTILELNGLSCIPLELIPPAKENIASQKSFGRRQTELGPISEALATYIARVAEKLRKQKYVAGGMTIWLGTDDFAKDGEPRYFPEISTVCEIPTDYTPYLIKRGVQALKKIFKHGYDYKRVGVMLNDLRHKSDGTQSLFYNSDQREKETKLIQQIDRLNRLNGRDTIRSAQQGFDNQNWKMKQENLSPKYTTRLSDIIRVK
jgi:DNA polymerase V